MSIDVVPGIEAAVAAAEQDGLRFLLRVQLVVLAAVAVWLLTNYAPWRLTLGLATVGAFALLGVAQYELGRRCGRPVFWAGAVTVLEGVDLILSIRRHGRPCEAVEAPARLPAPNDR